MTNLFFDIRLEPGQHDAARSAVARGLAMRTTTTYPDGSTHTAVVEGASADLDVFLRLDVTGEGRLAEISIRSEYERRLAKIAEHHRQLNSDGTLNRSDLEEMAYYHRCLADWADRVVAQVRK